MKISFSRGWRKKSARAPENFNPSRALHHSVINDRPAALPKVLLSEHVFPNIRGPRSIWRKKNLSLGARDLKINIIEQVVITSLESDD